MLAEACAEAVELWHARKQRVVATLRLPGEYDPRLSPLYDDVESSAVLLGSVDMSSDCCTVVASQHLLDSVFIWVKRSSQSAIWIQGGLFCAPWVPFVAGFRRLLACSPNGKFLACDNYSFQHIEVHDDHGSLRAAICPSARPIRSLSFDEELNVLIEWHMGALEDKREQWSVWRWHHGATLEPLSLTTPHIRNQRYLVDANRRHVATFDSEVEFYHCTRSNAQVRFVVHFRTVDGTTPVHIFSVES